MWEIMLQCHKHQFDLISKLDSSVFSESNLLGVISAPAMAFQSELKSLYSSFMNLNFSHRSYLLSINQWLLKCVCTVGQNFSKRNNTPQFSPRRSIAPPIYVTLQDWLRCLQKLPEKEVSNAIKDMLAETTNFIPCEEEKLRNELPENAKFLHRLESFLGCLKMYSESSVTMYVKLLKSINNARKHYENSTGQA